jgi:uncharacterized Zn finger protein (UPF0148 family)
VTDWQCENCGKKFHSTEQQYAGTCLCPKCKANIEKSAVEDEKRKKDRKEYLESKEYQENQEKREQERQKRQS